MKFYTKTLYATRNTLFSSSDKLAPLPYKPTRNLAISAMCDKSACSSAIMPSKAKAALAMNSSSRSESRSFFITTNTL